jgi:hypothetical protein
MSTTHNNTAMTMVCCMCGQQPLMTAEHILALAMGTLCGIASGLG